MNAHGNWVQIYNGVQALDIESDLKAVPGRSYLVIRQNPGLSGASNIYRYRVEVYTLDTSSGWPVRVSATKQVLGGAENLRAAKLIAERHNSES